MDSLTPLLMRPVLAEKPWGGRKLGDFGKQLPDHATVGESWEVADLPADAVTTVAEPRSRVASGPYAGSSLRELIDRWGADLLGSVTPTAEGDFPLLVKLLDAREHLSIQVHPDASYVADHPEARLKAESWYVIDAAPDSHLYLGLRQGVTREDIASRIGTAGIVGLLDVVPATAGDFHHLPAGLVHALGAGVLVAEVQTPSDTTFRIYDWEDRYDRPNRAMHGAEALEAVRPSLTTDLQSRPDGPGTRDLHSGDAYWIREHRSRGGPVEIDRRPEVRVIMVVAGSVEMETQRYVPGDTVIVPAASIAATGAAATPGAIVLEIGLA